MQGKTRSQKPSLIIGLEKSTRKRRSSRISEELKEVDIIVESCLNVEPSISALLDTLESEAQLEKEATLSKLSGETSSENYTLREKFLIEVDRGWLGNTQIIMDPDRMMDPPPYLLYHPSIHWLGREAYQIVVP